MAQELQQLPGPVLLADLEQRFAGQFSVGEARYQGKGLITVLRAFFRGSVGDSVWLKALGL